MLNDPRSCLRSVNEMDYDSATRFEVAVKQLAPRCRLARWPRGGRSQNGFIDLIKKFGSLLLADSRGILRTVVLRRSAVNLFIFV
jgi:hypothetical protein